MKKGSITFIGLGLYDKKDLSVKGLEYIKKSSKVFAEFYTAKLMGSDIEEIQDFIGKKFTVLDRKQTEKADIILDAAENSDVSFLTAGDPMTATTHIDLRIRAEKKSIKTNVIHAASIATAVPGLLGLQNYKFGRTTTLAYPEGDYFPTSPYDVIKSNRKMGLHTLILLDIQADKNRFMTAEEALDFLLKMEDIKKEGLVKKDSIVCVVARAGSEKVFVVADTIERLLKMDFGAPLHSLVFPGSLHFMEIEALETLAQLPAQQGRKLQKL